MNVVALFFSFSEIASWIWGGLAGVLLATFSGSGQNIAAKEFYNSIQMDNNNNKRIQNIDEK